jgi:nucleoside-diphosphate-sugar epimerase
VEILITGGNGLLGRHLVPALQERGDRVSVLILPAEDGAWLRERGITVHRGDITRPETLAAPMEGTEAVLHLAGMMGLWRPIADYRAVNVTGTENVCRAALAEGVRRVVHVSSWTVYGMDLGGPAREDQPLQPFREPYAITKAEGDLVVQRMIDVHRLPAVIVRPGTFFGPGDHLHFGRMADRLRAGKGVVVGPGDNALPFVYVADVVQGLLLALDHERAVGNAYNITNDRPLTQREFLEAIARAVGARPPRVRVPYRALYAAGYAAERLARATRATRQPIVTRLGVKLFGTDNRHAIDKARRELGYQPRIAVDAGIGLSADWYRTRNVAAPARALVAQP